MKVDKPWGHEIIFAQTDKYVGKILFIKSDHKLSLQHHEIKDETIRVLSGIMILKVGNHSDESLLTSLVLTKNDTYRIKPGVIHRMIAIQDVTLIEVSTPELDDVVRHKDDYGRV